MGGVVKLVAVLKNEVAEDAAVVDTVELSVTEEGSASKPGELRWVGAGMGGRKKEIRPIDPPEAPAREADEILAITPAPRHGDRRGGRAVGAKKERIARAREVRASKVGTHLIGGAARDRGTVRVDPDVRAVTLGDTEVTGASSRPRAVDAFEKPARVDEIAPALVDLAVGDFEGGAHGLKGRGTLALDQFIGRGGRAHHFGISDATTQSVRRG